MGMQKVDGFTIIEVMLVLAVTGLMIAGLLVGTSTQVNTQEYRSSVNELQAELQKQYSLVQNPINDRLASQDACGTGASSRGESANCLIIGRLITSNGSANQLIETPVLGYNADLSQDIYSTSSGAAANGWSLFLDPNDTDTYNVTWGSTLQAFSPSSSTFNILVIMSPVDGSLHTYTNTQPQIGNGSSGSALYSLLYNGGNPQQALTLCVESPFASLVATPLAVQIAPNASGSNSITLPAQQLLQSQGLC